MVREGDGVLEHVARAQRRRVEHHQRHLFGRLVRRVVLHAPQQLLDERVPRVDLQRLLLALADLRYSL